MMTGHNWAIGLLSEIEVYFDANNHNTVARAISAAISVAIEETNKSEGSDNVIYMSDYLNKTILQDQDRIVTAFLENIEAMVWKE